MNLTNYMNRISRRTGIGYTRSLVSNETFYFETEDSKIRISKHKSTGSGNERYGSNDYDLVIRNNSDKQSYYDILSELCFLLGGDGTEYLPQKKSAPKIWKCDFFQDLEKWILSSKYVYASVMPLEFGEPKFWEEMGLDMSWAKTKKGSFCISRVGLRKWHNEIRLASKRVLASEILCQIELLK